jgi:hypothetical protein
VGPLQLSIPLHARYPEPTRGLGSGKPDASDNWFSWFLSGYVNVVIPEPIILLSSCKTISVLEKNTEPVLEEPGPAPDLPDRGRGATKSMLGDVVSTSCEDIEKDCVLSKQQTSLGKKHCLSDACQLLQLCRERGLDVLVQTRLTPSNQVVHSRGGEIASTCDEGHECTQGLLWVMPSGNMEHEAFVAWVTLASALFTCCAVGLSVIRVSWNWN